MTVIYEKNGEELKFENVKKVTTNGKDLLVYFEDVLYIKTVPIKNLVRVV